MPLTKNPRFPILVIDTASAKTHVGLGSGDGKWSWHTASKKSGVALFQGVASCLKQEGILLESVLTVIFCEGPGSMLGLRTAAMAIRTWRAIGTIADATLLTYSSLALAAEGLSRRETFQPGSVAIDARRKSWYFLNRSHPPACNLEIHRVPVGDPDALAPVVFLPKGFPVWNERPPTWLDCPYDPRILENEMLRRAILRRIEQPDAFMMAPPTYKRWTPTPMTKGTHP